MRFAQWGGSGLGGALRAPLGPVAAPLASSLRAPFRPHPPHEGPIRRPRTSKFREPLQKIALMGCVAFVARFSTYPGGRGGKERAASLRAEQRLAPGGGAPCPGVVNHEKLFRSSV